MKVTLHDIGRRLGVSPSTVQRALNDLPGVGKKRREEIKKIAEEMGYTRNLTASALKAGTRTIAVVLPETIQNNRFYARYLWEGALGCSNRYRDFNLAVKEFTYVRTAENHTAVLRSVLDAHGDTLDGILTMGERSQGVEEAFSEMRARHIPVVLVGTDARPEDRLCCVRTYDEMAGRMAADLLINFTPLARSEKVIMTGDFSIPDQFYNAQGFERHIFENSVPLEIIKLAHSPDLNVVKESIKEVLNSSLSIRAVYATSSRNTVPMCQAVLESAHKDKVHTIGSDIFPESIEYVRQNTLNAIIHKRPFDQAYRAMQTLINHVVKGDKTAHDTIQIDSVIVMKSNIECFL